MKLPIRIRLAAVYCVVLAVVVGAVETGAYLTTHAAIDSIVDHELETRLAGIDDHLTRHLGRYSWEQMAKALDVHPAFQPQYLVIRSVSGQLLYAGAAMRGLSLTGVPRIVDVQTPYRALRVLFVRRTILDQPYDLAIGTDLSFPAAILQRLWLIMLLSIPPLLVVCAAAGYWMSGRALAPVRQIVNAARSVNPRRLSQRVPVPGTGDEVQQLADTFNAMLDRIETGFRQVREFTANASHELRTPVAIIRAAAEVALLRPRATEASYRRTLERILRESERNSSLIESMLELSRLEASKGGMDFDNVDLGVAVSEACERMASIASSGEITLRRLPPATPVETAANPDQVRRLCLILLDNAVKYTPAGGTVTARAFHADGVSVIEISDTGIGIAPEHQEHVFQRFYRTDKARSRAMGGAGLGLAIANEIVKSHNARIHLASQPGQGTRVTVAFQSSRPGAASESLQTGFEVLR